MIEPDLAVVSGQLGRTARNVTGIAVRCPFGRPAVIESGPVLSGKPNPTLLYLTCPTAVVAISEVEGKGGVKGFKAACQADPALSKALDEVAGAYRRRRAALAPAGGPRPQAGIGGPEGPDKASCLHAYAAALLAAFAGWFAEETGEAAATAAAGSWDRFLPPRDSLWCSDDRCGRWAEGCDSQAGGAVAPAGAHRVAAIDIGTISVRLLVADIVAGRPEQVLRQAEITRLGQRLRAGGSLSPTARRRTGEAVRRFVVEARRLGAARVLIAGTSAWREAADGPAFVRSLGDEHCVAAKVLTGAEEAALAYEGASLDITDGPVVLDVGGGSTELIRRGGDGEVEAISLRLGASRDTEHWITADPPLAGDMDRVLDEARALVDPLRPKFGAGPGALPGGADRGGHADRTGAARLVGVAGTVTTLACLEAGLQAYDAEVIHLRTLSLPAVKELAATLASMTTPERAALPCVQAGRAPVIVAGALIVQAVMETLGYEELTVSERDILDGLALAASC